jgi:iron(III) transport system permease protein
MTITMSTIMVTATIITIMTDAAAPAVSPRARFDAKWLVIGGAVLVVAWLALLPLIFLVWQSFMTPLAPDMPARFTLGNYFNVYTSSETFRLLGNSVVFAGGAASLSLALGTALAWMNERTNVPFKSLIYALSVVPLVIPGILFVAAWIMLASPKIGILNLLLQRAFGTDWVFFDVYTLTGMMWVDGIQHAPIAFLLMSAALKSMDPSLEESALMSGASMVQVVRRVTLKLAFPALAAAFLILFVRSIESFENPALLGLPVGIQVFTSSIYEALHAYPSDVGLASTYAITLLAITSGGIYWQSRLSRHGSRYATVGGKGFRPRVMDLGRWRYAAGAFFLVYAALVIGLPFLVLLWSSLQRFYTVPSLSRDPGLPEYRRSGVEQYCAGALHRDRSDGADRGDRLARTEDAHSGALAARQYRFAADGDAGPRHRACDHDFLSRARRRHLRHHLDFADRLYDALYALWHALHFGVAAAAS